MYVIVLLYVRVVLGGIYSRIIHDARGCVHVDDQIRIRSCTLMDRCSEPMCVVYNKPRAAYSTGALMALAGIG